MAEPARPATPPKRAKILVVEDEEGVRRFIQRVLEPTYEVHLASNGGEGLKQTRWVKPDLILLDIRMPGIDGLTVLATLKAHDETRGIPVVIISVRGETDALMETQRGGAVDHLIKPFDIDELRRIVERQLIIRSEQSERSE